MVKAQVVATKLADLEHRVKRVREKCPANADPRSLDLDALDIIAFNLMLAVQAALDIASHVIADEGWTPATTLAGAFQELATHGVLRPETAAALGKAAGLRNVVAHGYAGVDVAHLVQAASVGLGDLEAFAREVATCVAPRSGSGT